MKTLHTRRLALIGGALSLLANVGCAPQAIFFHESTKVGASAAYNLADSQPIGSHFGFKRRIAAVVPGQERVLGPDGREQNAGNKGEALSLVSKFYVRVGSLNEGMVIRNNFATGEAARELTRGPNAAAATNALLHNQSVVVNAGVDRTDSTKPAQAVASVAGTSTTTSSSTTATPKPRDDPPAERPMRPPSERPTPPPATRELDPSGVLRPVRRPADNSSEPTPEPQ